MPGSVVQKVLLCMLAFYRHGISPYKRPCCRFHPSCSAYAAEAVRRYGAARGLLLAVKRLCRCHPFGGSGYDPVP